jgi:hypothetical protein
LTALFESPENSCYEFNGSVANSVRLGRRMMFQLISLIIALGIGFACGYGVRELKSRRHRAVARKEYLRKQENKRYSDSNGDVWLSTAPRISDTDGSPIVPETEHDQNKY